MLQGYILKPFREGELLITIELAIKRASVKKKIQDNSNWLYSTLNNINDAVITVSDENQIIFLNDSAKDLLGNTHQVGETFDSETFITVEGERTFFRKEDRKIDIEYFQTDIKDVDEIIGKVHFIHDISKQVAFEIGLENARIAAENSNRSKNDFLANVTHELRTPLNTIIGMNSLISEISVDDEINTMHELIGNAAGSLLKQVNDILELSEIESGKLKVNNKRFSIQKVMEGISETFKTQVELKSIEVLEVIDDIPLLIGDKTKIRDIISSLMSNAVKFTKQGQIHIKGKLIDKLLEISIEDSGIGLKEDQKQSIFELFTQGDGSHSRMFGGTGMGLTLANNLIDLLNGSIKVEDGTTRGCVFTISIPVEISEDQKSKIEEVKDEKKSELGMVIDKKSKAYVDLLSLMKNIKELIAKDNFITIENEIKKYSQTHNISELNYESQVLFRVSIAIKLKNKEKFHSIMDEVLIESANSTGGIYENSYS